MATPPPPTVPLTSPPPPPLPPQSPHTPSTPAVKAETPTTAAASAPSRSPEPTTNASSYTITIPSCSGWFSWGEIHETEKRLLPEFFNGKSASKNPSVYKYFRDSIIGRFRAKPSIKLTFTEARRGLIGDVGSIRRVFDFLEEWGLINYTPAPKPKEKKEAVERGGERKETPKKLCTNCLSVCSLACFTTDKADITLCARCFVRGNYRPGLSSTDFKRVDITEEIKTDWTDKETLHLLEAILQYGEDWKKVAEHVGSRSEKDCIARFIKLPFGEQFLRPSEDGEDGRIYQNNDHGTAGPGGEPSKRRRLTPLADATNPIMAQVAFLSAIVGSDVAEAAAQSAIAALCEVEISSTKIEASGNEEESSANGQPVAELLKEATARAQSQLEKECQDVEQSLSDIVEVQMKEIQDKIVHFEKLESLMEKEWLQLRYLRDSLFADQLNLVQHQRRAQLVATEMRDEKFRPTKDVN
ncbi:SWI/SNF complex subunit SWI3B isoform X1 [Typha angustifolia]|uniref:SWI/SNF complex subunit SWI3B isoform X1 n=1 Tax=Typha angustifolia TaxID=59011 RepID=UPI003C2EF469